MKKTYLLNILFILNFSYSQTVSIPDANFKSLLIANGVDTNSDGEIQLTEAQSLEYLYILPYNISSFEGIQNFTNTLELIIYGNNPATSIDINQLNLLTSISIDSYQSLSSLIIDTPNLEELIINYTSLSSLNLESLQDITLIDLSYNQLEIVMFPTIPLQQLYSINISHNNLVSFNCSPPVASYLNLSYNKLTTFDCEFGIDDNYSTELYLQNNLLTSINFNALTHYIQYFDISNNQFSSLDFTGLYGGEYLFCGYNTNLTAVKFHAENNFIFNSLRNNPNLTSVDFQNNTCDACFGISGIACGLPNSRRWYFDGSPNVSFCVDNLVCSEDNDQDRTEEFYFSHINIIYSDSVIPISTPPTNQIATSCSLNTSNLETVILKLFPNPVETSLYIETNLLIKNIRIYNTLGQVLKNISFNEEKGDISIDVTDFKSGIYFIKVSNDFEGKTIEFVKK